MNNFEHDAAELAEEGTELANQQRLSDLVKRQVTLEDEVAQAEAELKVKKKALLDCAETLFIDLMDELGYEEIRTSDGAKVTVKKDLYASIPKKNKIECGEWLKKNGQGSLVQTLVMATFDSTEEGQLEKLQKIAALLDIQMGAAMDMNTARIKSMIKELMEKGEEVPLKLFGAYERRYVKIDRP